MMKPFLVSFYHFNIILVYVWNWTIAYILTQSCILIFRFSHTFLTLLGDEWWLVLLQTRTRFLFLFLPVLCTGKLIFKHMLDVPEHEVCFSNGRYYSPFSVFIVFLLFFSLLRTRQRNLPMLPRHNHAVSRLCSHCTAQQAFRTPVPPAAARTPAFLSVALKHWTKYRVARRERERGADRAT